MNLTEFRRDWELCPEYVNQRVGKKQLWRCDYFLPNGIDYQYDNRIISTWDSYNTTICGFDNRVKIDGKIVVLVGACCTYSPTTRQHTGYIARELGFSYYDFKHALTVPYCRCTNDTYTLVYCPEQKLFNDKLNRSTACDLLRYYEHALKLGFLNGRKSLDFHSRGVDLRELHGLSIAELIERGYAC